MTRYLGIDYGSKRIGLAVSDEEGVLAFPYDILDNSVDIIKDISDILEKEGIDEIVLGESLDYKREKNLIMDEIENLRTKLEVKIPVHYEEEFLTSHQAHQYKKGNIDDSAAAILLQSFLDKKNEKDN